MRITSMSAGVLAAMMTAGSSVAFAGTYQWTGGDGRWADATKWYPNGVPGTALDDAATFTVNATQTVTVDADATPRAVAGKPFDVAHATIDFGQIDVAAGK